MSKRILAVLDENLVERFCNGTPREHNNAEGELQHRLSVMLERQGDDTTFSIEGVPVGSIGTTMDAELTAKVVLAVQSLQAEHRGAGARIVKVDFWPGEYRLLVMVNAEIYHINGDGEIARLRR